MTTDALPGVVRRSPLEGAGSGDPATVSVVEVPFTTAVDLRGDPGPDLPPGVGATRLLGGGRRACCLGPDWWLVLGPAGDDLLAADAPALLSPGSAGSAVDVSAHRTRIDVHGPRWADVLRHVWARDLDALAVGRCAQGPLARAHALLVREDGDRVAVHVRASFARYAFDTLTDAALEYSR